MTRKPLTAMVGSAAGVAMLAGFGLAVLPAAAAPSYAATDGCPVAGEMPGVDNSGPSFVDANVSVFAGGDFRVVGSAAESEGLLVVTGDATFDKQSGGVFNIGTVGVGSGISPAGGEVMSRVGGTMTVIDPTRIDVGAIIPGGGAVVAGGAVTGSVETNGASVTQGIGAADALKPYGDFGTTVAAGSASLAAESATGTAARSGQAVTFTGDDTSAMQVFTIAASDLDGASEFHFSGIPSKAPVVINVTGSESVSLKPNYTSVNGEQVDYFGSPNYGNAAASLLWNLPDSSSVSLAGGGQFMGSIVAPKADAAITSSTNGRVLIGGDIEMNGSGNEFHAYPWTGGHGFECVPEKPTDTPDPGESDKDKDAEAAVGAEGADGSTGADATTGAEGTDATTGAEGTDGSSSAEGADAATSADSDAADTADTATGADADAQVGADADVNSVENSEADAASGADAVSADSDSADVGASATADASASANVNAEDASANATATANAGGSDLPRTGAQVTGALVAGGLLLGLGAMLITFARRRRS